MKLLLVALALLAMPPAASAAPQFSAVSLCQILQPCEAPIEFASGPFLAPPVIRHEPLADIQMACNGGYRAFLGNRTKGPGIMGCASFVGASCIVYLPSDIRDTVPELYDLVRRHELAHCRGWVHGDYTNASF